MSNNDLLGLRIETIKYVDFIENLLHLARNRKSDYVCFANVHMVMEAYFDQHFARVVNNSIMVAPDGKALCWALYLLYGRPQERVAGMDLLPELLQRSEERKLSVFFYGGSESTLNLTRKYIEHNHPRLEMAGFISPPFRTLTVEEEKQYQTVINESGAHLVFVCLGCPKQEKWMAAQVGSINALMLGVGGALAVMTGVKKRAPRWVQNWGMEWLFRLIQEPARLFHRYATTNPPFIYLICKQLLRSRIFPKAK